MSIQLSDRSQRIQPSATLSLNTKATQMKAAGVDVVNLTAGEPDFVTPRPIMDACIAAIDQGKTHYSAINGILPLREAICAKLQSGYGLSYEPGDIIVSNGAKQSLYNATQAILNPGDEVIILAPYWVSYPSMVSLAGADSVFVQTGIEDNFKITAAQLKAAITPKARLLILNSPSNPSGMVYTEDELAALAAVLIEHPHITIISDDIYDLLCWGETPLKHLLQVCPELKDRTIVINGCSKSYAMTGWRIGYTAAPSGVTAAMKKIQSHSTSGPNTMAQYGAAKAVALPVDALDTMLTAYRTRLSFAHQLLNEIDGVECLPAQGAFYLYPCVKGLMSTLGLGTDTELSELLLTEYQLATVPGAAFGTNGYLRLSCACDEALLKKGIDRLLQCSLDATKKEVS